MTHGDPDPKQNQVHGSTYLISAIARFKGVPSAQWCFSSNGPASLQQRTRCAVLLWTRLTSLWRLKICILEISLNSDGTSREIKHVTFLLMCRYIRSNWVTMFKKNRCQSHQGVQNATNDCSTIVNLSWAEWFLDLFWAPVFKELSASKKDKYLSEPWNAPQQSTTAYGKLFQIASERMSQNPRSFKRWMIPWGQQMPGKSPMLPLHRLRLPQETATQLYLLGVGEGHCQIPLEVSSAARNTFFEALLVMLKRLRTERKVATKFQAKS